MSYQNWCSLGNPKLKFSTNFIQISRKFVGDCIGAFNVSLSINSYSEEEEFFVMAPGHLQEEVVLGKNWMAQRQCYRGITKFLLSSLGNNELSMSVPLVLEDQGKFLDASNVLESQVYKLVHL